MHHFEQSFPQPKTSQSQPNLFPGEIFFLDLRFFGLLLEMKKDKTLFRGLNKKKRKKESKK